MLYPDTPKPKCNVVSPHYFPTAIQAAVILKMTATAFQIPKTALKWVRTMAKKRKLDLSLKHRKGSCVHIKVPGFQKSSCGGNVGWDF